MFAEVFLLIFCALFCTFVILIKLDYLSVIWSEIVWFLLSVILFYWFSVVINNLGNGSVVVGFFPPFVFLCEKVCSTLNIFSKN